MSHRLAVKRSSLEVVKPVEVAYRFRVQKKVKEGPSWGGWTAK
jgi:hypothetical protein